MLRARAVPSSIAQGRFELRRVLGAGGSGVVYEAHDGLRDERVALKTVRAPDAPSLLRLKHEFRALADAGHPNLVTPRELGVDGDECFFTMELIDGVSFVRWVRGDEAHAPTTELPPTASGILPVEARDERGAAHGLDARGPVGRRPRAFDEARLRAALGQLAVAVQALHRLGKLHLDVKPANVLVHADGHLSLLDYGLVREIGAEAQRFEGTPHYAAPEQAAGGAITQAADWYAVGIMLFEALTGTLPFEGTPREILFDKRRRAAVSPRAHVADLPADLADLCEALLATDPARRPIAEATLRSLSATAPATAPDAVFVGRAAELATLARAGARARAGAPELVVVEGASGIGKSTLVGRALDRLRLEAPGAWVLAGRCHHGEHVPFNALDGVVDALARALEAAPPPAELRADLSALAPHAVQDDGGERAEPGELRVRACAALGRVLARAATQRPLAVWIDDLQWADADSRALLTELLRTGLAGVLVVLSRRPGAEGPMLPPATTLTLEPLDDGEARALLVELVGGLDRHADDGALLRQAAGHPMLLTELARQVRLDGASVTEPARALDEALRRRVSALAPTARALVELLSLCPGDVSEDVLGRALGVDRDTLARELAELRAASLVRTNARERGFARLSTYHDRVREAVAATLDDDARAASHLRLAEALEASPQGDPQARVHHLIEAGEIARAAELARAAADHAFATLAFDRAAELLRVALRAGPDAALERRLAQALSFAHRGLESADAWLALAGGEPDAAARREALRHASELLLTSGAFVRGSEVVRTLLDEIGAPLPKGSAAALAALAKERALLSLERRLPGRATRRSAEELALLRSVALGLGMADNVRAAIYMTRWLRGALASGDDALVGQALALEAVFRGSLGRAHGVEAARLLARADALAARTGDPELACWAFATRATVDALDRPTTEVIARLAEAIDRFRARTRGNGWAITSLQVVRALSVRLRGDFRALRALLPEVLADARRRSELYLETTMRRGANVLLLADDDPTGARERLAETHWDAPAGRVHIQHWAELEGQVETALYVGRGEEEAALHAPMFRRLRWSAVLRQQRVRVLTRSLQGRLWLAQAAAQGARAPVTTALTLARCAALARQLEAEELPHAQVRAAMLRAGVAALRGDDEASIAALRGAAELADQEGLGLLAAVARRRLGEHLGGGEGRALLDASEAWMALQGVRRSDRLSRIEAPF
jgi:hypothetical protein